VRPVDDPILAEEVSYAENAERAALLGSVLELSC
jgi:hypothetical protein